MNISILGNPGRPGMTLNVPYCSDVTNNIVEFSAANYLNSTCTVDRLELTQSLRRAAGSLQNRLAHFALCHLTVLFSLKTFPCAFLFDLHIFGLSHFLHKLHGTYREPTLYSHFHGTSNWSLGSNRPIVCSCLMQPVSL